MKKLCFSSLIFLVGVFCFISMAQAASISSTLGNDTPGFADGSTPGVPAVGTAIEGQPAPFNQSYGTDGLFGGNFSASWTHSYAAIADPILSASITFGIYDHDSAATGSQLASFVFEGVDLTTSLDSLFETSGEGADGQYDIYSLMLPGSAFAGLADGSATGSLSLQGPGLVFNLFPLPGAIAETTTNGANLIFSTLDITTQDGPPAVIPEPSTWALFLLGLGVLGWRQRRRKS